MHDTTGAAPRLRLPSIPTVLVLALALGLVALSVVLSGPVLGHPAALDAVDLPWWALAVAFAATEAFVLHIQVKREAQTVSVSELPLVLGLFFASPVHLLLGRLVGSAAILIAHRRSAPLKTAFNLALVAAETAVAVTVFILLAPDPSSSTPMTWLAAYAAALLANAVGAVAIGLVIAVYDGGLDPRALLRDAVLGQAAAPVVVTVGLVSVTSLSAVTHSAWLLVATGAGLLVAYRAYAGLSDRHLNLERLYRFSQAVGSAPEMDGVVGNVLAEAMEMLRSERAEVLFVASSGGQLARVRLGAAGRLSRSEEPPSPGDEWLLRSVVTGAEPVLLPRMTRDPDGRRWLDEQAAREAVAVPLRGGAGIIGALVVTDRLGDVRSYDDDDVLLLETVANHAGIALQNGELIDKLRHEALHDALTGLPNRTFLQRRLGAALDAVTTGRSVGAAVMILDLNGFKEVNDTLGHQQGDLLLAEVGLRLQTAVGRAGVVARLGGDEFAVLLADTDDESHAVAMGRRVLRALDEPLTLDGLEVAVSGSIGIARAPLHATDAAGLLKRADMAMYDAKASSRGLRLYEPELDTHSARQLVLVPELRAALESGDIVVHVQPKARLATGEVVGVEALVRWEHAQMGTIRPDEFVPVAERSGLIGPLTSTVLSGALAAYRDWRTAGHDLHIAVNLSTRSLHDVDLVDEVARGLRRYGVPGDRLTLEVTEGSVMADPGRAIAVLHQLRELGVRLSVDDFGTGYSSLSYLKKLPVQEVKIDRSFVSGLADDAGDVAIVRAIVDLGRHLGLQVVAEGVEDQATWDLLAGMGCDLVQGYLLGRAMPVGELPDWLDRRAAEPGRTALRAI